MATKVQTTVQHALTGVVSWLHPAPSDGSVSPRDDRLAYLWLAVGIILFPFAGVRWTIPLAAWLLPVFWLRFVRTQPAWRGSLLVLVAMVLVALVDLQGVVPVTGVYYVLMVVVGCVLGILPYLAPIVALPLISRRRLTGAPAALGRPYFREERL